MKNPLINKPFKKKITSFDAFFYALSNCMYLKLKLNSILKNIQKIGNFRC